MQRTDYMKVVNEVHGVHEESGKVLLYLAKDNLEEALLAARRTVSISEHVVGILQKESDRIRDGRPEKL